LTKFLGAAVYSRKVLLDMNQVNFLDTGGASWLIGCHHNFLEAGGGFVLHSVPPRVDYVLQLLHLHEVLTIANGPTDALALVSKGRAAV